MGEVDLLLEAVRDVPIGRAGVRVWSPDLPPLVAVVPLNQPFRDTAVNVLVAVGLSRPLSERAYDILAWIKKVEGALSSVKGQADMIERAERCSGWLITRPSGVVYAHHRRGEDCTLHGEAREGADRGLRRYVRREDEGRVALAIERQGAYRELRRCQGEIENELGVWRARFVNLTEERTLWLERIHSLAYRISGEHYV